jgi:peptide/nickel transport system substrate-binding protein
MRLRAALIIGLVAVCATSACGGGGNGTKDRSSAGFADCDPHPNTCNTTHVKDGGTFVVAIEKKLPNWNIFDSDGSTFEAGQVMAGITPIPFPVLPDSTVSWSRHLFASEPQVITGGEAPMTVVLKVRPEAVWNDNTPIGAQDFAYYWRSNNGRDCPACTSAATAGYDAISAVTGSDNDRTVTLTFSRPYLDWRSLFGNLYPAHIAQRAGNLSTPEGLKAAFDAFKTEVPTWSGGPYKFENVVQDVSVAMVRNDRWYGTTKPTLDKVIFKILEDQPQQVPALRNKEVHALTSQPNGDMVAEVKKLPGVNYHLAKGPNWEHIDANTQNRWLADPVLRRAIFTAIDRQEIIDKTVGTFFDDAAPLNNHSIMPGSAGYRDVVTPTGQGSGDAGRARKILTDAGYRIDGGKLITKDGQQVAPLRFRFTNGNQLRQQTAELVQKRLEEIGVKIVIDTTDRLGNMLSTGDFDLALFGWVGTAFLADKKDLWTTGGGGNYGHYSNAQVDALINEAVESLDDAHARELFNQADELMTADAYNLPLFQKAVFLAVYSEYGNVRNNPTASGPMYNCEEWGIRE